MPHNTVQGAHFLDQEVVNGYCGFAEQETSVAFQTVRGCFPEGLPVYAESKILRQTHVQMSVRDAGCILKSRQVPSILLGKDQVEITSQTKSKSKLPRIDPHDPRVTAAILKRIEKMPIEELDAFLAHRNPGVIDRQYPDPTPVTREELLRRQNESL